MQSPVEHEVIDQIAQRWSPYRFEPRVVEDEKLVRCLEAARWAASSFNDQPWSWIVARRQDSEAFEKMLGCLLEANQGWAQNAGVLLLSVVRDKFAYNGKPNRVALHDLGQAAAHFSLQATALGLQIHQMAGVNLSQIRVEYGIPEGHEPQTAIAVGYVDESQPGNKEAEEMASRDSKPRKRKSLSEQVFDTEFGQSAGFLP